MADETTGGRQRGRVEDEGKAIISLSFGVFPSPAAASDSFSLQPLGYGKLERSGRRQTREVCTYTRRSA